MKNFTNNFKQFTSRLSARWLIMALMLLVGTSSAWAATYLSGEFNSWDAADSKYLFSNGTLNVSMNPGTYQFKVVEDGKWYSMNNTNITGTVSSGITMYENNNNNNITITYTGVYTFIWDGTNDKLKVTYPPQCTTCCTNYYVAGESSLCGEGWDPDADIMDCLNDEWSITFNDRGADTYTFKITDGTWDKTWNTLNTSKCSGVTTLSNDGDGNMQFKTTSEGDITISFDGSEAWVTFENPCSPSATLSSAVYDAVNNEIDLSGSIETCDNNLFYGFLWKNKNDANWNTANAISGTGGSNNNTTDDIDFNQSWDGFTPGDTYEFTAYALDATTNPYTWYYSTDENNVIEVSTCTSIPDNTYAIAGNNEWTGNANPVTINYDANTYGTPTILYDGEAQIPTGVGTYAITINVPAHNGYCASTISLGDYEITCIDVEKPAITTSATVCEGTKVTLSNYNGVNTNTVKWYSNSACTEEVTEQVTLTDDKDYYAKAYHAASGCSSSEYSTLAFTVNPLPTISISGNNSAVLYEDVELTAATDGTSISWEITEGDGSLSSTTGNSVTLTSSSAGNVTVTATATSTVGCTSAATKTVIFSAEDCNGTTSADLIITCDPGSYTGDLYCYIFGATTPNGWSNCKGTKTNGIWKWEFNNINEGYHSLIFHSNSKSDGKDCKTSDLNHQLQRGYQYDYALNGVNSNWCNEPHPTIDPVSGKKLQTISAPAAKTISVSTTDGEGNIIFSGQVVKTGCDDTNEYGFQYSSDEQTWTTVKVGENAAAGTPISNNTVTGLDGTYYVRAYITNDNSTQYGAVKEITVSTKKYPITTVTLTHVRNQAGDSYSDQELENLTYCVGDIVWFKLEQDGSNFQEYQWISYPGTELKGMYTGGMFQFKITKSGNVGIRLRNDANVDGEGNPTWVESDPLEFNTHPEPISPTVSLSPNVICSNNDGATLSIASVAVGQTYVLYKYADENDNTGAEVDGYDALPCIDANDKLSFTNLTQAGRYFVKTYNTDNCQSIMSASSFATLEVVDASDVFINFDPTSATTTPWMPAKFTVNASDKYTLTVPEGVVYNIDGNKVSVKIPLPEGSTGGDGQYENVSFPQGAKTSYTITANLATSGGIDNPCAAPATATITLTPYVEPCTEGH